MYFTFRGGRISYRDIGTGAPVLLLHGYLETAEVWNGFAEKLSEKFRVITADLPGHGNSDSYGSFQTMDFMATASRELLDSLGIKKAFLAGHSLGGYVTLAFLDLFPASLSGYCLFHSQPFPDTPETAEKRRNEIALVREGKKELFVPGNITKMYAVRNLEKFHDALLRSIKIASGVSDEGIIAVLNGMIERPSRLSAMEEGRVPCLWMLGELDNYIPCEAIQKRVSLPQNARIVILRNSGHMGFIEEADKSLSVISEFVAQL
jgi:pimeloyl-ACP methyl ester carboxylesterase